MDQAQAYYDVNSDLPIESKNFLDTFLHLANWKPKEIILEIGVGPAVTTVEVLLPSLPSDFVKLIGIDNSDQMLEFAKKHHSHPKVEYIKQDIVKDVVADHLIETFDHIFSFFCFHWIDQKMAWPNTYKMLKHGGEIFIMYITRNPLNDMFERKSPLTEKWAKYDHKKYISTYHGSNCLERSLEEDLLKIGFTDITIKEKSFVKKCRDFKHFCDVHVAVNSLITSIDAEDVEEYINDYISELKKEIFYKVKENGAIEFPLQLFHIYAKKI